MAESENETTWSPTDQSTAFSTTLDSSNSAKLDITREELEKRQLLHSLQLLKLELSQKNLMLDTVKTEGATQLEEVQERLTDVLHEKRLLQMRLKSTTQAYEQELRQLRRRKQNELEELQDSQRRLEEANPLLSQRVNEIKQALNHPQLSEVEYKRLRTTQDPDTLPLKDYVMLRYHELTSPLQREAKEKEAVISRLTDQLAAMEEEATKHQASLSNQLHNLQEAEDQRLQARLELSRIRTQIQEGNYKVDNFDAVKRERDSFESEVATLQQAMAHLEEASKSCREEKDQARRELSSSQQAVALLNQDKDYLTRQVSELSQRANMADQRSERLSQQLSEIKEAKGRLCEEMLKSQQDQKRGHEQHLQEELEALRARSALEMDQLKSQMKEVYERENRAAHESRENAVAERDRALLAERETASKCDHLKKELHQLQSSSDNRLSKMQTELQAKHLECERAHVLQEDASRSLRQSELEQEKLKKKVEVLTEELWSVQSESEARVRELEARLQEGRERLDVYEKLEKELDEVVMQAAEVENESDAERVLFSYGFGASVPSTSRRRMQQSVQLARRVLQLERLNASLRRELEDQRKGAERLREELASVNTLVEQSQQPYSYLIESIRSKDEQLRATRESLAALQGELGEVREERAQLIDTKNDMAADLERLLSHREELALMKQVLLGLQGATPSRPGATSTGRQGPVHPTDASAHLPQPAPTLFTKKEPPQWYKKLRQRSQAFSTTQTT